MQQPPQARVATAFPSRPVIETCRECGGAVKVIAYIEDLVVIEKILTHLNAKATSAGMGLLPESRAPPQAGLFN